MTVSATTNTPLPNNLEVFNPTISSTNDLTQLLQNGDQLTFDHQGTEFTLILNPATNNIELWSGQTLVDNDCQFNSYFGVDGFIELRNGSVLGHDVGEAMYLGVDDSGNFKVYDASHELARGDKQLVLAGADRSAEMSNWTFYRPATETPTTPSKTAATTPLEIYRLNQLPPGQYTVQDGQATDQNGKQFYVGYIPPTASYQVNSDQSVQRLFRGNALAANGETGNVELRNGHLVPGIPISDHQIDLIDASTLPQGTYTIDSNGFVFPQSDSTQVMGRVYYDNGPGTYHVSHTNGQTQFARQASNGKFYAADTQTGQYMLVNGQTIAAVGNDISNYSVPYVNLNELPPGRYNIDNTGIISSGNNAKIIGLTYLSDQAGVYTVSGSGSGLQLSRQASNGQFYSADPSNGRYYLFNHKINPVISSNLSDYSVPYIGFDTLHAGNYNLNPDGYVIAANDADIIYGQTYADFSGQFRVNGQGDRQTLERQASDGNFYKANINSGLYELVNNQTIPAVGSDLSNYDLAYIDPTTLPAGSYTVTDDGTITSVQNLRTMIMGLSLVNLSAGHYNVKMTEKGAVIELV